VSQIDVAGNQELAARIRLLDAETIYAMDATDAEFDAQVDKTNKTIALWGKEAEAKKAVAEQNADAAVKAVDKEMAALEKFRAQKEAESKKTVKQILEENAQRRDEAKEGIKDFKKAERLEAKKARGIKIGAENEEWLAAFNNPFQAQADAAKAADAIAKLQKERDDAMLVEMKKIPAELVITQQLLTNLLQRGM